MSGDDHLRCSACDERIGVARRYKIEKFVCGCTHDDGPIEPVTVWEQNFERLPERWEWVPNGGGAE